MKFIFIQEVGAALWVHNNMVPAALDGTNGVPLECTPKKFTDISHDINSINFFL